MSNTNRRAAEISPQVQRVLDLVQTGVETQRELCVATGLGKGTIKHYLQQLFGQGLIQRSGGGYVSKHYGKGTPPPGAQPRPSPKPKARPVVLESGLAGPSKQAMRGGRTPVRRKRVVLEMAQAEPWVEGWWRQEAGESPTVAGCDTMPHGPDGPTPR